MVDACHQPDMRKKSDFGSPRKAWGNRCSRARHALTQLYCTNTIARPSEHNYNLWCSYRSCGIRSLESHTSRTFFVIQFKRQASCFLWCTSWATSLILSTPFSVRFIQPMHSSLESRPTQVINTSRHPINLQYSPDGKTIMVLDDDDRLSFIKYGNTGSDGHLEWKPGETAKVSGYGSVGIHSLPFKFLRSSCVRFWVQSLCGIMLEMPFLPPRLMAWCEFLAIQTWNFRNELVHIAARSMLSVWIRVASKWMTGGSCHCAHCYSLVQISCNRRIGFNHQLFWSAWVALC